MITILSIGAGYEWSLQGGESISARRYDVE
jgi:hypothetical protein